MTLTLPAELYRFIVAHVSHTPTLFNLLLTNRLVSYEAERALYHTIERQTAKTQIRFMKRVLSCPRVAALVQSFDVAFTTNDDPEDEFWTLISKTLQVLVNLTSLRLLETTCSRPVLAADRFPFKLKTLVYWGGCTSTKEVAAFLSGQDSLEKLVFHSPSSSTLDVPETALRNLKSIQADASTLSTLLPGRRHVSFIQWSSSCSGGGDEEEEEVSFGIEDSFPLEALKNLKALSFSADTGRFASMAEYLIDLESIEIHNPHHADLEALRGLLHLRHLTINNVDSTLMSEPVIQALFDDLDSLRSIYIENTFPSGTYNQWKRGADSVERRPMVKPQPGHWTEANSPKFAVEVGHL